MWQSPAWGPHLPGAPTCLEQALHPCPGFRSGRVGEPETRPVGRWCPSPGGGSVAEATPGAGDLMGGTPWKLGPPSSPSFPDAGTVLFGGRLLPNGVPFLPSLCWLDRKPRVLSPAWGLFSSWAWQDCRGRAVLYLREEFGGLPPACTCSDLGKKALSLPGPQFPPVNGKRG